MNAKPSFIKQIFKPEIIKLIILIVSMVLAFFMLTLPNAFRQAAFPMQIGDVASQNILAPYSLSFESEVLTAQARQEAVNSIDPIYLPTDPSIGRRQVERLRTILNYLSIVRQNTFASVDQKTADIEAIEGISLSEPSILWILQVSDTRWSAIELEATSVLEQIMRNTLRDSDIFAAKRNIPSLIDFGFPEDQANIVVELVEPFVVPNSLFSPEATETAIAEAVQSVEPVSRSFVAGETLVRVGQIIREVDWEALQRFGLIQQSNRIEDTLGAASITMLIAILLLLYFRFKQASEPLSIKAHLLIAIFFLLFLGIARFFVLDRTIIPYIYPIAAFGLTLSIVFNIETALVFSLILGTMTAYGLPNGFDLTIFYIVPAFIGMLTLGKARRIGAFFLSGLAISMAGIGIILGYRLPDLSTDWIGVATLSAASIVNGLAAASLTLLLQYIFSMALGITTSLQLLDTSRPDHPLLQIMLRNAPGSYQHSLQVANLAEQAAEAIGADSLLVRVGAIYHDCGKAKNPHFFIENQVQNEINPHDGIDPYVSAQTIISHVTDGVKMAKKHRLPNRIIDFIKEHHGTMHTHYQYTRARNMADDPDDVDIALFTYPGPRPQSKETALLMLADGTEARARAEKPKDEDELKNVIETVFTFYEQNHQLDDTDLTLKDLEKVKDSYFHTLKGSYHPRIKYPAFQQPGNQKDFNDFNESEQPAL